MRPAQSKRIIKTLLFLATIPLFLLLTQVATSLVRKNESSAILIESADTSKRDGTSSPPKNVHQRSLQHLFAKDDASKGLSADPTEKETKETSSTTTTKGGNATLKRNYQCRQSSFTQIHTEIGISEPDAINNLGRKTFVIYNGRLFQKRSSSPGDWLMLNPPSTNILFTPKFAPREVYVSSDGQFKLVFAVDVCGSLWKLPIAGDQDQTYDVYFGQISFQGSPDFSTTQLRSSISDLHNNRYLYFFDNVYNRLYKHDITGGSWQTITGPQEWLNGYSPFGNIFYDGNTAIVLDENRIFVVQGSKLYEYINGNWVNHGKPGWRRRDRINHCGAPMPSTSKLFCVVLDNRMYQRYENSNGWHWHNHGKPWNWESYQMGIPSTVAEGKLHVKAGYSNSRVQELYWYSDAGVWNWYDHGTMTGGGALTDVGAGIGYSFVSNKDTNEVWERYWSYDNSAWQWRNHGVPN